MTWVRKCKFLAWIFTNSTSYVMWCTLTLHFSACLESTSYIFTNNTAQHLLNFVSWMSYGDFWFNSACITYRVTAGPKSGKRRRVEYGVVHGRQLGDAFHFKTGVRKRFFLLVVDLIMKTFISERKHRKQCTTRNQLEEQMQMKTICVAAASVSVGRNIRKRKITILKFNTQNTDTITFDQKTLNVVEIFIYLGSTVHEI